MMNAMPDKATEDLISSLREQARDKESLIPDDEPDSIFADDAKNLMAAAAIIEGKPDCHWCRSDENGQYNAMLFEHPDGKQKIKMFLNGAKITLTLEAEGDSALRHMATTINYCPMCGRPVRTEAVE